MTQVTQHMSAPHIFKQFFFFFISIFKQFKPYNLKNHSISSRKQTINNTLLLITTRHIRECWLFCVTLCDTKSLREARRQNKSLYESLVTVCIARFLTSAFSSFFFFFFLRVNSNLIWVYCLALFMYCLVLFTYCSRIKKY